MPGLPSDAFPFRGPELSTLIAKPTPTVTSVVPAPPPSQAARNAGILPEEAMPAPGANVVTTQHARAQRLYSGQPQAQG